MICAVRMMRRRPLSAPSKGMKGNGGPPQNVPWFTADTGGCTDDLLSKGTAHKLALQIIILKVSQERIRKC